MGKFKAGDRVVVNDRDENLGQADRLGPKGTIHTVERAYSDLQFGEVVDLVGIEGPTSLWEWRFDLAPTVSVEPEITPELQGWSLAWHSADGSQVAVGPDGSVKVRAADLNGERSGDWDVVIPPAVAYEILMDANEKRGVV